MIEYIPITHTKNEFMRLKISPLYSSFHTHSKPKAIWTTQNIQTPVKRIRVSDPDLQALIDQTVAQLKAEK
jgi:hypothetical protein